MGCRELSAHYRCLVQCCASSYHRRKCPGSFSKLQCHRVSPDLLLTVPQDAFLPWGELKQLWVQCPPPGWSVKASGCNLVRPGGMGLRATCSDGCDPCPWQGSWNAMVFKFPSTPNHSLISLCGSFSFSSADFLSDLPPAPVGSSLDHLSAGVF